MNITIDKLDDCKKRIQTQQVALKERVLGTKSNVARLIKIEKANGKDDWRDRVREKEFSVIKVEGVPR